MKRTLSFVVMYICLQHLTVAQQYVPNYFAKQEMEQDLVFLHQKLANVHPKFLNKDFAKQWQAKYDLLSGHLSDSISEMESFVILSKLLSEVDDDHTALYFPYSTRINYMKNGGLSMPFSIRVRNNKLYINEYFAEQAVNGIAGAELLSINSIDSKQLLHDVRVLAGNKNGTSGDKSVERLFAMCCWMLYGETKQYELKIAGFDSAVLCKAVTNDKYFELKNKLYPPKKEKSFGLQFSENNEFACLKIASFYDTEKLASFLRHAFDSIQENKCGKLIIDVSDNPGGRSSSVDSLLNYLTSKAYSQYSSISVRPSLELKSKYKESKPDFYKLIAGIPADSLYHIGDSLLIQTPHKTNSPFTGEVFVLVNGRSNSAAATFAGAVKRYHIGKIIGEPTGGTIKYYGDFLTFTLPCSGLTFVVSAKEFIQYGNRELTEGVLPDFILAAPNSELSEIVLLLKGALTTNN
ncbi:S41 family peptidase [Labilibaculum sp. K2S]|uniref:S41 family peptidase n=1 Tax=Labilibaculum sp. K2S TaxID=3056386 RepID=UPI0025A34DC8|nr:S41 family peptidase [Labilibaculum sp. K2S]MDM8158533.1 S41 family peptidase [Labilibaculum sp. K2S]